MQLQNIVIVFVLKIWHDFKDCMDSGTSKEDDFFFHMNALSIHVPLHFETCALCGAWV